MSTSTDAAKQRSISFIDQLPYTIALAGRCCAVISAAFSTGLGLVFTDADPKDFARLAQHPVHMGSRPF